MEHYARCPRCYSPDVCIETRVALDYRPLKEECVGFCRGCKLILTPIYSTIKDVGEELIRMGVLTEKKEKLGRYSNDVR